MKKILVDEAVLQAALDALALAVSRLDHQAVIWDCDEAITVLRATLMQAQEPIGEVVCIDYSSEENGPEAIVALHQEVELGTMLYAATSLNSNGVTEL